MKRTTLGLAAAALTYALSWFVPVIQGGTTLGEGRLPGWEAFRVALSPVLPYEGLGGGRSFLDVLGVISALTNLGFVASLAALVFVPRISKRAVSWGLVLAALVNTMWFVVTEDRSDLRAGYYLWLGSFVTLALATRRLSRSAGVAGSASPSLAPHATIA